ncbi:GCN5 family acetyltransferase [Methylobacterium sp. Leaf361]|uniref:GNAT family N-acetyltransferase n=1 Tax=Methylobacterium sp. Leaf361 TaxID=1736352 RepID=UPI0006F8A0BA|nr:N-acetyltransferase [Methylobacterium sp. Leaf361]KQS79966.1 GCN5 family acetyltransferase [Methylobacterium sp. Leaf361]
MIEIRAEHLHDVLARERLLDACFPGNRRAKTSERLREGRLPARGLAFAATRAGRLVGTLRLWHVEAGLARPALLLGPLAVDPAIQGQGLGSVMMQAALGRAESLGHGAVLLVGDAPYYARFGFDRALAEGLTLPGPFERARFLGLELRAGALAGAEGMVRATGVPAPVGAVANEAGVARRRAA